MQYATQIRKILPVFQKVCDSFGERMNANFLQVMFLLASEQPWYDYLRIPHEFQPAQPIPSHVVVVLLNDR